MNKFERLLVITIAAITTISIIGVKIFSKIDASNSTYTEYSNEQSSDDALSKVLKRIAGTYELVEDMGIYGLKTIYTVTINKDGTGYVKFASDGSVEHFYGASLSGPKKIVFQGDYGGTPFGIIGDSIVDESASKEHTEIGTMRYHMRRKR